MGRLVMGFWDCKYCGEKAIKGSSRECPSCGVARDKDTKFYMNLNNIQYVSEENNTNNSSLNNSNYEFEEKPNREPNWICDYCDALNSSKTLKCASCGSARTESNSTYNNYNHVSVKGQEATLDRILSQKHDYTQTAYTEKQVETITNKTVLETNSTKAHEADTKKFIKEELYKERPRFSHSIGTFFSNLFDGIFNNIGKILIILASILVIAGLIFLLSPKYYDVAIQEFSWERNIYIENLKTVDESGWNLPSGARLHFTREEIYDYEQVLDHYETKIRTVTKSKYVGEEEYVVGYRDLGNGYFEEITSTHSVYDTYLDEEPYQEPIYRNEPIYKTKYYYEIDKWLHERTVTTRNSDKNPYWGNVTLLDKERISSKQENYYITVLKVNTKKPEKAKYSISHEQWKMLEIGQEIKLKVTLGFAELVLEE